MEEDKAQEIIKTSEKLEHEASNFRNLYQEVADNMVPRENQIISKRTQGEDKSQLIYDPTAMLDLQDMVSGLSAAFFPPGELAFGITVKDPKAAEIETNKKYLAYATRRAHEELYSSNFMLQLNETLTSLVGFGTGCLFTEFMIEPGMPIGLNFKDWDVAFYTFTQNAHRQPDGIYLRYPLTARQAYSQFGDKAGEKVMEAIDGGQKYSRRFDFIHCVRPRTDRNPNFRDSLNLPYESCYVNIEEKKIVDEGGYENFPFAIPRWTLSSNEKWGRGQGTRALSCCKELQQMHADLVECGNKHNNPPREVLDHFEGKVRVKPGAVNFVQEKGTIRALEQTVLGNFPITKDILQMQQEIIHRTFFVDVFAPLANLTGDRRTTLEIIERVKQAMKKLALPVYRLQAELFTPTIKRVILLLIKNGRIDAPPPELQGRPFDIEYVGELALALRDQQSKAFQQFASIVTELDPVFPGAKHTVNMKRALPDIAIALGVKQEHLSTEEEIAAQEKADALARQQQMELEMLQTGGRAYRDTSKAPEDGSAAQQLQEQMAGAV